MYQVTLLCKKKTKEKSEGQTFMLLNAQFCPLSGEKGRPQFVPSIFPAQFPPHLEFLGTRARAQQLSPSLSLAAAAGHKTFDHGLTARDCEPGDKKQRRLYFTLCSALW